MSDDTTALLRDLARAQALFQARAIAAVMGLPAPETLPADPDRLTDGRK